MANKESEACWSEFLRAMIARGLRIATPRLLPMVLRAHQRHRANLSKEPSHPLVVPQDGKRSRQSAHREGAAEEFLAPARAVRDAPTQEAGQAAGAVLIERFGGLYYPTAVSCFAEDLEASLAHLKLPVVRHRINVRTTNLSSREASWRRGAGARRSRVSMMKRVR